MFEVKDSGARQEFESGMVRDTTEGKTDYTRILDGPMFDRWADHLSKGAVKYPDVAPGVANWTLANGDEDLARFKKSAMRHFRQWLRGDVDEDHAAAVYFNVNGAEYVKGRTTGTAGAAHPRTASAYSEMRAAKPEKPNLSEALTYHSSTGYERYGVRCCSVKKDSTYDCSLPVGHAGPHCDTAFTLDTLAREWD
jgi:hypothetical protein